MGYTPLGGGAPRQFRVRPSRLLPALVAAGLVASPHIPAAHAEPTLDASSFRPGLHRGDLLGVGGARGGGEWEWAAGSWVTWVHEPLRLVDPDTGEELLGAVDSQLVATLYGNLGLTDWLDLAVGAPLVFADGERPIQGSGLEAAAAAAPGDLRVSARALLTNGHGRGLGLGLVGEVSAPTSSGGSFGGEGGVTPTLLASADYAGGGFRLTVNAGARLRDPVEVGAVEVGSELLARAGAAVPVRCGVAELVGSVEGRTALSDPFGSRYTNALDGLGGVRAFLGRLALTAAAGGGMLSGFGSPAFSAVAQIAWAPEQATPCASDPPPPPPPPPPPDADGDGVVDAEDACAGAAGPAATKGCPDGDADGVADAEDACPGEAGKAELDGCPDGDGDGLRDPDDRCPMAAGAADLKGCPDGDGDGVADRDDRCPAKAGMPAEGGCPKRRVEVVAEQHEIKIHEQVGFKRGKTVLDESSHSLLDEVAAVLRDNPQLEKVRVEGHTSGEGGRRHNVKLAKKRAKAVVAYLVAAGVDAERLKAAGYGDKRPLSDNDTPEGRARNRRVAFTILAQKDGDGGGGEPAPEEAAAAAPTAGEPAEPAKVEASAPAAAEPEVAPPADESGGEPAKKRRKRRRKKKRKKSRK